MKSTSSKQVGSSSKNTVVLSPKIFKINSSLIKSGPQPITTIKMPNEQNVTSVKELNFLNHKVTDEDLSMKLVDGH